MLARIAAVDIWDATGIQGMPFNTLYQLAAIASRSPDNSKLRPLLLMPDLIAHRLSAARTDPFESDEWQHTQMMTPGGRAWNVDLLDRAGLPSIFLARR